MAQRNEECYTMCQDWIKWLESRKFLGTPSQRNILDKLMTQYQVSKTSPDGMLSADLNAFNTAVMSLEEDRLMPFLVIYCKFKQLPVKTLAYDLNIDRTTFYQRAHKAASDVLRLSKHIKQLRLEL